MVNQIILTVKSGKLVRFEETKPVQWEEQPLEFVEYTLKDDSDEVVAWLLE
jgi:hypothetical protein